MKKALSSYEKTCNVILFVLLSIWFVASFGCGILFREWLDQNAPSIGNAPFGFWMAQQGSIITFVLIIIAYVILMNRADDKHGYKEDND
jgi:putative solute:sodium symporter small subunit